MKSRILVVAFALAAPPLHATELYCTGQAWPSQVPGPIEDSRVLRLEAEKKQISVSTFAGPASGTVRQGDKVYYGLLSVGQTKYLVNLDRFTGELSLLTTKPDGTPDRMEFSGSCQRRSPQF